MPRAKTVVEALRRGQHPEVTPVKPGTGRGKGNWHEGAVNSYNPVYCKEVIEFCAAGFSVRAFAGAIGVPITTLQSWRDSHQEFDYCVKIAMGKKLLWWEGNVLDWCHHDKSMTTNSTLVTYMLSAHFPHLAKASVLKEAIAALDEEAANKAVRLIVEGMDAEAL